MRATKKDLEYLFIRVCEVYNLSTKDNNDFEYHNLDYYRISYNPGYGYSFRVRHPNSTEDFAFNAPLTMTAKEAYCFLSGLLAAKFLIK